MSAIKISIAISKKLYKAYKVQYGLGFQKYYLFTAYIFTKKQAKYVLQKNKYSLALENKYDSPKNHDQSMGYLDFWVAIRGIPLGS